MNRKLMDVGGVPGGTLKPAVREPSGLSPVAGLWHIWQYSVAFVRVPPCMASRLWQTLQFLISTTFRRGWIALPSTEKYNTGFREMLSVAVKLCPSKGPGMVTWRG